MKGTHNLYSSNIFFTNAIQNNTISTDTSRSRSSKTLRFNEVIYHIVGIIYSVGISQLAFKMTYRSTSKVRIGF